MQAHETPNSAATNPIASPSTVLFGEMRGASGRRPNVRPPTYAPVSPTNVPTSTLTTTPSPCGRSRSMTACAKPSPIQARPSIVTDTPGMPPGRACSIDSRNTSGRQHTKASSARARPPACAATSSPARPASPARRDGRVNENIWNRSCRQIAPSANRPAANTQSPKPTISSAKAIAGIAAAMRGPRSPAPLRGGGARRCSGRRAAISAPSQPAPAARELGQRGLERLAAEVGPQLVAEHELRVRRLPQQVVGQALLAGGADHEVGVVHLGRVQEPAECLLAAPVEARGGVEELAPPAVVERHEQRDPVVVRGLRLRPVHLLEQRAGHGLAPADEPHPDALLAQLGRLGQDPLGEHPHEAG